MECCCKQKSVLNRDILKQITCYLFEVEIFVELLAKFQRLYFCIATVSFPIHYVYM